MYCASGVCAFSTCTLRSLSMYYLSCQSHCQLLFMIGTCIVVLLMVFLNLQCDWLLAFGSVHKLLIWVLIFSLPLPQLSALRKMVCSLIDTLGT